MGRLSFRAQGSPFRHSRAWASRSNSRAASRSVWVKSGGPLACTHIQDWLVGSPRWEFTGGFRAVSDRYLSVICRFQFDNLALQLLH